MKSKASTQQNNNPWIIHHIIIIVIGIIIALVPFVQSGWLPTSPDSAGLSCGAQNIVNTGEFSQERTRGFDFHYNPCWTQRTYPGNQVLTAGMIAITNLPSYVVVVILSIIVAIACAIIIYWIVKISLNNTTTAFYAGLIAITSIVLARSLLLTPHNLYGYSGILLTILSIALWEKHKQWKYLLISLVSIILLAVFHTLSLAILGIALGIFAIQILHKTPKKLFVAFLILLVCAVLVGGIALDNWNPINIVRELYSIQISGITNPWYDHPAVWGYSVTSLAILGIALSTGKKSLPAPFKLSLIIGIASVIFGHPKLTGIEILPERVIAFAWIPVTLFASLGLSELTSWFKFSIRYILLMAIFSALAIHSVIFIQDSYVGISQRYLPDDDFIAAMEWLEQNRTDDSFLLSVGNVINRQISYSGLWYSGNSIWYPWYRLNHKDITDFNTADVTYKEIIESSNNPNHDVLLDIHKIVVDPSSSSAEISKYKITHFLAWKRSQEYEIWNAAGMNANNIYENDQYIIYAL